jgi:hypothetical protein
MRGASARFVRQQNCEFLGVTADLNELLFATERTNLAAVTRCYWNFTPSRLTAGYGASSFAAQRTVENVWFSSRFNLSINGASREGVAIPELDTTTKPSISRKLK